MRQTPKERFDSKYIKNLETGCWEWNAYKDKDGYGTFSLFAYPHQAHRASWYIHKGDIPVGKLVCHTCDNTNCVNPEHLFIGDNSLNMQDMQRKGRANYLLGEASSNVKLTIDDVKYIRQSDDPGNILADYFGVTKSNISAIRLRKSWKHVE